VLVDFDAAFKEPEMVKPRLCVVLSKPIQARPDLLTVVPLSMTVPDKVMPYHLEFEIPFELPPRWGKARRWLKGDMIYSVGFQRVDLLRLGKDGGKRIYQTATLPDDLFRSIQKAVLHGLSLSGLTKHL
jgi:mRNA interferase MazF